MSDLRELAAELQASNAHGPWTWQGGYPQRITNPAAVIIADCFEDPDSPSRIAEFIAAVDPAVVLALLTAVENLFGDLYLHHLGEITDAQLWASGDREEASVRVALAGPSEGETAT